MSKPEIIGSSRSTYTRAVCMVCEEKAIDYVLTETAVHEQVAVLDKAVEKTGHLVGEQFTFADINLMPILHRFQQAPEGKRALAGANHLAAYYARHAARPSFQRTDPPPGPPGRAGSN